MSTSTIISNIKSSVSQFNSACRQIYSHPAGKQLFVGTAAIIGAGLTTLLLQRVRPLSVGRLVTNLCCCAIYGNALASGYIADQMARTESQRDHLQDKYNDLLARHYPDLPSEQREVAHNEEQEIDEAAEFEAKFEEEMRNEMHEEFANYYYGRDYHMAQ
ncbi:MAG: hypothetical protein IKO41_21610 [Lachnospiraceae bacterium]|nr:hypothetical protein [Lachnospiraceae bacterium]